MNCQKIDDAINELKVDSLGRIRGKSKVIDKIHSMHLTELDNVLMNIRIKVAKLGVTAHLLEVDKIIYEIQEK
jgi:hypothetical protein